MSKSKIQNPVVYKLDKESEVLYIKNFVIDLIKELKDINGDILYVIPRPGFGRKNT